MKHIALFISICILISACEKDPSIPANGPAEFSLNYGGTADDFGKAVAEYSNGDLFIVGSTQSFGAVGKDVFLIKTDKNGNTIWSKTFGGLGNDEANEIVITSDGNIVICGTTDSYGAGGNDIYFVKVDTSGNILWEKYYGGVNNESAEDVLQNADGSYLITGITNSFGSGLRDIYVLKINVSGNIVWTKTFGGPLDDGGSSLCASDTGDVMLFNFTDNYGAVNRDWYILRVNSLGDSLNSRIMGGSEYEEAQSIERTSDNNYILFGHTASYGHIEHNTYAAKIAGDLSVLWENNYGGVNHDGGEHGKQSSDGGYIFAGRSNSFGNNFEQAYVFKTDGSGNMIWQKDFGGDLDDAAYNLIETTSSFCIVGNTKSITNGNNDVFLIKILKP